MKRGTLFTALFILLSAPIHGASFRRGDANIDERFDISDPVNTLSVLFLGEGKTGCEDAMDSNDDGKVDITDGIYSLASLFTGGPDPKPPYPDCGVDPGSDGLGCEEYPGCAECLDQKDIDQAILESVPAEVCIAADAAMIPVPALSLVVVICPKEEAKPCGSSGEPGCPVKLTTVKGALDVPGRRITVHVEGHLEDFPVYLKDSQGLNDPILCTFDVDFRGDVLTPFTVESGEGSTVKLKQILDPTIENVDLTINPSPGFLCSIIASQKDQFVTELETQLTAAAADLIAGLRAQYEGSPFCP
jgi:hypothetical protein